MVKTITHFLQGVLIASTALGTVAPSVALANADKSSVQRVRLGPVYRIAEPDMLEELQSKLKAMQANGTLKRLQDEAVANAMKSIARPHGSALPRAVFARAWIHDPTYVVPSDIADHQGRTFAFAGDRVNPLERGVALRNPLLFLDADDAVQVRALPGLVDRLGTPKVILVAGDWRATSEQIQRPVFFDQRGSLVKTFGISALPAVVEQSGNHLTVKEIVLEGANR